MATKQQRDTRVRALAHGLRTQDRQWLQDEIAALPAAGARTAAQTRNFRQYRILLRMIRLVLLLVPGEVDETDTATDPA